MLLHSDKAHLDVSSLGWGEVLDSHKPCREYLVETFCHREVRGDQIRGDQGIHPTRSRATEQSSW